MASKKIILLTIMTLTCGLGSFAFAKPAAKTKDIKYTISPLFGYETVFRATPTPHTATRSMYGARLTVGSTLYPENLN